LPINTKTWLWPLILCAASPVFCSGGQWDGRWFYDTAASTVPSHTYTLQKLSNGSWRRDDGDSSFEVAPDGKSHLESGSGVSITVTRLDTTNFDYVEVDPEGATTRHHQQLSADSATITDRFLRVYATGKQLENETTSVRVGKGSGFEGRWKTMPKPFVPPPGPYWVITSSPDGTMTWTIPFTGEVIQGKADGQSRAIAMAGIPSATTFIWKQPSPDRLEFYASEKGALVEIAIETLSQDGKTFTDTLWSPSHEDEKRISVYRKQ
jgi:hypothetical protein